MYPTDELTRLATKKQLLVMRSTVLRAQCVVAGTELARPIVVAEGWYRTAKKFLPYLRLASALFGGKGKRRPVSLWSLALKWGPSLFQAFQWFRKPAPSAAPPPSSASPEKEPPL